MTSRFSGYDRHEIERAVFSRQGQGEARTCQEMEGSQAAPKQNGPRVPSVLSILPSAKSPLLHTSICAEQLVHACLL